MAGGLTHTGDRGQPSDGTRAPRGRGSTRAPAWPEWPRWPSDSGKRRSGRRPRPPLGRAAAPRPPRDGRGGAGRRGARPGGRARRGGGGRAGRGRGAAPRRGGGGARPVRGSTRCAATWSTAARPPRPRAPGIAAEVPIASGDESSGRSSCSMTARRRGAPSSCTWPRWPRSPRWRIDEARDEVEQNLRGSFLEELRSRPDAGRARDRAPRGRLGCDLSGGGVVLCAELSAPTARATSSR